MGITLEPALVEAAAFCGVEWPTVDESALTSAGEVWARYATTATKQSARCNQAIDSVKSQNEGPGLQAFLAYVAKRENATATLQDFTASAPQVAAGFHRAARVVAAGKAAAQTELVVMAAIMARTKGNGAESVGPLLALKVQTRRRVEAIWEQTARALRGDA